MTRTEAQRSAERLREAGLLVSPPRWDGYRGYVIGVRRLATSAPQDIATVADAKRMIDERVRV